MAFPWEPLCLTLCVELYLVLLLLLLYSVITPLLVLPFHPIEDITTRHPGPCNIYLGLHLIIYWWRGNILVLIK